MRETEKGANQQQAHYPCGARAATEIRDSIHQVGAINELLTERRQDPDEYDYERRVFEVSPDSWET